MELRNLSLKGIVEKFVKSEKTLWAREMKIAKSLISIHGNEIFSFIVLGFKLNSLAWFKTEEGQKQIEIFKKQFSQLNVEKKEIVFDNTIEYKNKFEPKKTIKDLLK